MVVLAGIALIVVGPEKLPGLARNIGRFVNDLKRTTNTIASDITNAVDEENFLNSDKKKKADQQTDKIKSEIEKEIEEDKEDKEDEALKAAAETETMDGDDDRS